VTAVTGAIATVLDRGEFCHVAARTERGPHLTPLVFALSGGSVWVTTSRGSVKARTWRTDDVVAGLVRGGGDDAVTFAGRARAYDLLDADTWPNVLARAAAVAAASLRFSRKNARFFAGYAVDSRRVPLAWTPPGRVFVEIELDAAALIRDGEVVERAGEWRDSDASPVRSRSSFRAVAMPDAFEALPNRVRRALGEDGEGALALEGERGPAVVPARWRADDDGLVAAVPIEPLGLADATASCPAALAIDRPSWWRARRMLGCMVQGTADLFVPGEIRSGRRAVASAVGRAGADPDTAALARMRPRRLVWWEGWTSGSVGVA
jgi:Pyridoxamine 5'-phosphate oxidase